jgi:abortive infection bacteriophage resistance protein
MSCNKPAKTYVEQLQILKNRGLIVADEPRALHCLEHHNYYRLSAYRFPLTIQGNPDQFLPGTTFDELWNLYHFDRTLRQFVAEAVKRVEISVRAH